MPSAGCLARGDAKLPAGERALERRDRPVAEPPKASSPCWLIFPLCFEVRPLRGDVRLEISPPYRSPG
eukprot:5020302-Alexandrium_andersonii.AAC.1